MGKVNIWNPDMKPNKSSPDESRQKKILVVTNAMPPKVSTSWKVVSIPWNKLDRLPNLSDFDVLVIDLSSCENRDSVDWETLAQKLSTRTFFDIAGNGGKVLVIGDPTFAWQRDAPKGTAFFQEKFLSWTGVEFTWKQDSGDTVESTKYGAAKFEGYLRNIKTYSFYLTSTKANLSVLNLMIQGLKDLDVEVLTQPLAVNRHNRALAFDLQLIIRRRAANGSAIELFRIGPLIIVPSLGPDSQKSITAAFDHILKINSTLAAPEWIDDYSPIGQAEIDTSIASKDKEIEELAQERTLLVEKLNKVRSCLRLFFDDGLNLEGIVREALRELNATVEEPVEPNKEDGWITVKLANGETLEGVLEIKSTEKSDFDERGIRQLSEWKTRGTLPPRSKAYKGMWIGSNSIKVHPSERTEGLSDNLKKSALLNDLVLLKGEHLYTILMLHRLRALDLDSFWTELFNTKGVFNITVYQEKLNQLQGPRADKA